MALNKKILLVSGAENIRKVNSVRFPKGCIYILKKYNEDLYKIGVSQNVKRRIRDISSILPFEVETVYISELIEDVYDLELIIHSRFKINKVRKEWFDLYKEDIDILINILNNGI